MEAPLLKGLVILSVLSIPVVMLCHRLRIPSIVGFLLTGILCGPHGLGLIRDVDNVFFYAKVGIILLLFSIGMEFSIKQLVRNKRYFILAGLLQVSITVGVGAFSALVFDRPFGEAVFFGFLLSLSSTAIVMRILHDRSETGTSHGKLILGILIFQDVIFVFMILLAPFLAVKGSGEALREVFYTLGMAALILGVVFFSALRLIPRLLHHIARTRSRELFILSVLAICFSVTWLSYEIGLTLSVGGFLAGLIISESEYSSEAIGRIIPFQDVFTSLFFVSIGMLLDIGFCLQNLHLILLITAVVVLMKGAITTIVGLLIGVPLRMAIIAGFSLAQVGEFSFVLTKEGIELGIATDWHYQLFLSVSILSMGLTPFLMDAAPYFADLPLKMKLPLFLRKAMRPPPEMPSTQLIGHVVLIGLGVVGQSVIRSCKQSDIPYLIIDMDPDAARSEKAKREPIIYGDASHEPVLRQGRVEMAKVIAVSINEEKMACRILQLVRKLNQDAHIIVRTRFLNSGKRLYDVGANEVIPDEFSAAVEFFTRVLKQYRVPVEKIEEMVEAMRSDEYEILHRLSYVPRTIKDLQLDMIDVSLQTVEIKSRSPLIGQTWDENKLQLKLLFIKRSKATISENAADCPIEEGDHLVVIGSLAEIEQIQGIA